MARTFEDNRYLMTGDDLLTLVTGAASETAALAIVRGAPVGARYQAADLLYVDADAHGMSWVIKAIVREARA